MAPEVLKVASFEILIGAEKRVQSKRHKSNVILNSHMFSLTFALLSGWLLSVKAEAAIIYVDKSNACPGTGTATSPYCSLQNAFNAVNPGDTIRIRNAATPYDQNAVANRSGTATSPITVEPDVGHNPVLRYTGSGVQAAAIQLEDVDYWTVRNLTFDGSGTYTSQYAIWIRANTRNVTGNSIIGNTVLNWGGTTTQNVTGAVAIQVSGRMTDLFHPINSLLSGNTISSCRHQGIGFSYKVDTIRIINNTISNLQEGREVGSTTVDIIGIGGGGDSFNVSIIGNTIHDHQSWASTILTSQGNSVWSGIWLDVNGDNGTIANNRIYNIGQDRLGGPSCTVGSCPNSKGTTWQAIGILIESRCDNWLVRENLVYNTGLIGIRNGSTGTGDPNNNQYVNNAVYNPGDVGLLVYRGNTLTVKNNIIHNANVSQIQIASIATTQGPHVINYNDYYDASGGSKVGQWGAASVKNFSGWKADCSCDGTNSINQNPLFDNLSAGSEDLHLQSGSPACRVGESGVDMGAYPIPGGTSLTPGALPAPSQVTVK
jgi:hypothetical protein